MEELKKCPFCGSENVRLMRFNGKTQEEVCIDSEEELDEKGNYPYIHCYECCIDFCPDSFTSTPRKAIQAWNRRCCE